MRDAAAIIEFIGKLAIGRISAGADCRSAAFVLWGFDSLSAHRMSRYGPVLFAAAIAGIAAVVVLAVVLGRPATVAAPSIAPSATAAPTASPTVVPTASPTATAASSPSLSATVAAATASAPPLAGVRYVSALLGYSIQLPPPWHRSACMGPVTQQTPTPRGEVFWPVPVRDETGTDVGTGYPSINVLVEDNPQGLTPRQWAESGRSAGTSSGERIDDVTYADRPAARKAAPGAVPTYFVAHAGRMYVITPGHFGPPDAATQQTMVRIVESFRFLTPAEQAAARVALPTAAPPRTPEQVADGVAAAFVAKNADALAAFLSPCVSTAGENAGASFVSREKYVDDLRAAFAAGLVVTVQSRPFEGDRASGNLNIASRWQDPRRAIDRKLMLRRGENDRWEWHGTLERFQ